MTADKYSKGNKGHLLGRQVSGSESYDPALLFPVPRAHARAQLPAEGFSGFGTDLWHAYELSWLNAAGMPEMYVGRLAVPATTPNLIESKSLKLYLNSLNNHRFANAEKARETIEHDLGSVAGEAIALQLLPIDSAANSGHALSGECLDALKVNVPDTTSPMLLTGQAGDAQRYTHLLRSLCPVTAQPDWATLVIETRGRSPTAESLLAYLLSYRNHQEFHEQCVERIFMDIWSSVGPDYLAVQAFYTRRGGLDISPFRCSQDRPAPAYRLNRQ